MMVIGNVDLGGGLFVLTLAYDGDASPGQFFMVKPRNRAKLLGRPISVFSLKDGALSFLIKKVGGGTDDLARLLPGEEIVAEGPFGRGFPEIKEKTLFIGGGTGIAPSLHLLEGDRNNQLSVAIGLREPNEGLQAIYAPYGDRVKFYLGANIFDELEIADEVIYTCGPDPMMREAVKRAKNKIYVSMEKHMGCGFGACLACTCEKEGRRVRVCKDGPVFEGRSIYA
ncbi:iron-sulfur cluster-binding protein [Aedoeadaptatus pacaensis]|uniref:iron-sulfur cluster-binding protein n=1 Tax=Aedoeadaptatus pacaensis TaxID=1776390 RepID=UPI000838D6F4|nr:hypothetical protein [Peptoniphilus pacaensis]